MGYYYDLDGTYAEIRNTYETTNVGPDYWGSSHHIQLRDFYRSVREDLPVEVDGLEAKRRCGDDQGYLSFFYEEGGGLRCLLRMWFMKM